MADLDLTFPTLARRRRLLQELVRTHYQSVFAFFEGDISDKAWLTRNEWILGRTNFGEIGTPLSDRGVFPGFRHHTGDHDKDIPHITTSARAIESLLYCPREFLPDRYIAPPALAEWFAGHVLMLSEPPVDPHKPPPARTWPENGAPIYTRVRSLPLAVAYCEPFISQEHYRQLEQAVEFVAAPLGQQREGIGEQLPAHLRHNKDALWWPPSAYLNYWFLRLLQNVTRLHQNPRIRAYQAHSKGVFSRWREQAKEWRKVIMRWTREEIAVQATLHQADAHTQDTDQLAWAVATYTRPESAWESDVSEEPDTELVWHQASERALIGAALACLVRAQGPSGIWRHARPIFNNVYGMSYSSVFEVWAEIIKNGLDRRAGFLRALLRDAIEGMDKLVSYAENRAVPLSKTASGAQLDGAVAWASGHNVAYEKEPEGWITATIFMFLHQARRLVGEWTYEASLAELTHGRSTRRGRSARSSDLLQRRGATWTRPNGNTEPSTDLTLAEELSTLFVNPSLVADVRLRRADAGLKPIDRECARSAILYGPPGTSKTSLAKGVAQAIGWDFVEVHVSDFITNGHDAIEARAAEIFERILELDRCVVLFDEVDELFREREGVDTELVSRFLTTSMLPKVAELWAQRRALFLVATNRIEAFDAAITRAERFDATLFVPGPCEAAKLARLTELVTERMRARVPIRFVLDDSVRAVASKHACPEWGGEPHESFARMDTSAHGSKSDEKLVDNAADWFRNIDGSFRHAVLLPMLRYDQMAGVAAELCAQGLALDGPDVVLTAERLSQAIKRALSTGPGGEAEVLRSLARSPRWRLRHGVDPAVKRMWFLESIDLAHAPALKAVGFSEFDFSASGSALGPRKPDAEKVATRWALSTTERFEKQTRLGELSLRRSKVPGRLEIAE